MNLTGSVPLDDQIDEALHAVALAQRLQLTGRWLDVGSGGGFPGLILAACLELDFVFVEPRAKRASNLELALAKIGRRDVSVLRGRVDEGRWLPIEGPPLQAPFDVASARAVFSAERWLREARPWLRPGGLACLHLRARDPVPDGATIAARVDGPRWSIVGVSA